MSDAFGESNPKVSSKGGDLGRQASNQVDLISVPEMSERPVDQYSASTKTMGVSKSQAANAYAIVEKRKAESRGVERGKTNLNVVDSRRLTVNTPEMYATQGTEFGTEKVSRVGTSGIHQSKENIILSEISSKNAQAE